MKTFRIQYDATKNTLNKMKHSGVSLADTELVFYDEAALVWQTHDHEEQCWCIIGKDATGRILLVAYTYRDPNFVRPISARLASKNERRKYLEA